MNHPELQLNPTPRTILCTLTGDDRHGVASALLQIAAAFDAIVLDFEQSVVRGRLLLVGLFRPTSNTEVEMTESICRMATDHDLQVTVEGGRRDNLSRCGGYASVVIIGAPLTARSLVAVTERIAKHGANIDQVRRLASDPVTTLELDLSGADVPSLRHQLALDAATHQIDIAVTPGGLARRGRHLIVMDVDSTLIQDEVIELLAAHAGRAAEVIEVTERTMRGELDFEQSLHERVRCLAGLDENVLQQVRSAIRFTPGARTLVRTVKRLGFSVAVVSGGFIEIVAPLAAELGIAHAHANQLEVVDEQLTGRLVGQVVDRAEKARTLKRFAEDAGLPLSRTVAIGDGANDLDMLAAAGLGIAFNAKPVVRARADATVNVPYLDVVLFMLGISREDVEEADRAAAASKASSLGSPHA